MTATELKKRAIALAEKTKIDSVTPEEVGQLSNDIVEYIENVEINGSSLGIRKTYTSVSAMEGDSTAPKDDKGVLLRRGMLVNIYNQSEPDSADNGKVFSFQNPGWAFRGTVDAGYATKEELTELDTKVESQKTEVDAAKDDALQAIQENEQSAIINFNKQKVTPEMLSESTKQLIEASGGGTITNLADDEDITSVDDGTGSNVLKFSNKEYNPVNHSGRGYVILRKNIVDGKNVLTSSMVNKPNTTYIVRYDFVLTSYITVPQGTGFYFDGGSIIPNGNEKIRGYVINEEDRNKRGNIRLLGHNLTKSLKSFELIDVNLVESNYINVVDFGIDNTGNIDVTIQLQQLINDFKGGTGEHQRNTIFYFPKGVYLITDTIYPKCLNATILGESISNLLTNSYTDGTIIFFKPTNGNKFAFDKDGENGFNFRNVVLRSENCTVTSRSLSSGEVWDGSNAQHYHTYNINLNDVSAINLANKRIVNNCYIYGFSGYGIKTGSFCSIENTNISNCTIGINSVSSNTDGYNSDTRIFNSYITLCKYGIKLSQTIQLTHVWIDEIYYYGIYNEHVEGDATASSLLLEANNLHINHTDFNAIYASKLQRCNIQAVLNRSNCFFAGYVYDNVPSEYKDKCSTIYAKDLEQSIIDYNQSGRPMLDNGEGGNCGVVLIIVDNNCKGNSINICGNNNDDNKLIICNGTADSNNVTIYGNKYEIGNLE